MFNFFRRIINFSGHYKSRIYAATIFSFLKGICIQTPIMIAFLLFNDFYNDKMNNSRCWMYFGFMVLIVFVNYLCTNLSDRLQSGAGYKIFADKRIDLGNHLRKMPMGYFTSGNIGKISSVLASDMVFIEENVMQVLADALGHVFSILVTCVFLFMMNWIIALIFIAIVLLVVITGKLMNKSALKLSRVRQDQQERLTDSVISHIEGIGIIKSYNLLGEKSKELTDNFVKTKDEAIKFEFSQAPWLQTFNLLYSIGMTAVFSVGLILFHNEYLSLPYLIGVILFAFILFAPLKALYGDMHRFTVMDSCLDRVCEVFDETELVDKGVRKIPNEFKNEISFENVYFSYEKKDVIKNVSFTSNKNTLTAIIGPSGSGKSTLVNLLARFWDIKSGSIKIRGVDIKEVGLSDLMSNISMVFQRVYLFNDTVYNNICMGRPNATKEEVIDAAKKARCFDFIMKLENGFDTVIGEGGASLSGGEKQRISIARCILKDAPIVILDEATASVDVDNEIYIQEAISELCKGKTIIAIAHRLNTIKNADKIIVLDDGKIIEEGTHDELINNDGKYNKYIKLRSNQKKWYQAQ